SPCGAIAKRIAPTGGSNRRNTLRYSAALPPSRLHPARQQRLEQYPQIEPGRPVVDVMEVVIDAAAHLVVGVGLAAKAVDLRPAGDARQHVVAARIERDLLLVFAIVRERMR